MLTGCGTKRLQDERDALWEQNVQLQDENSQLRSELDACLANRRQLESEVARLQQQLEARPTPTAVANTGFGGIEGIETETRAGAIAVRVPGDVLFASGKAELRATSKRTLDQIASVLRQRYGGNTIRVEGYTDTDPIRKSKWKDNLELSAHRAMSVLRYLASQGVSEERMYAGAFGEHHPRETKAKSRRVEIVVVTAG
jgi:flagellar motor protein MotB